MNTLILSFAVLAMTVGGCSEFHNADKKFVEVPIALTSQENEISDKANVFALNIYGKVYHSDTSFRQKDILISPLSLSLDLSMCSAGAGGETAAQMRKVLGFSSFSAGELNDYSKKLTGGLRYVDNKTKFSSANSVWYAGDLKIKDGFISDALNYYAADVKGVDFSDSATAGKINSWCADKTNNLITKVVENPLSDVRMMLINALYFKGIWANDFKADADQKPFSGAAGRQADRLLPTSACHMILGMPITTFSRPSIFHTETLPTAWL